MSDGWPTNSYFLKNWPQVQVNNDRNLWARLHLSEVKFSRVQR